MHEQDGNVETPTMLEQPNLRVRVIEGSRVFEAEGVESMVTHLLEQWVARTAERQTVEDRQDDLFAATRRGQTGGGESDAITRM